MAGVGTDALRFGLLRHDVLAMDVNVDLQLCTHASLTCNKLFNAFRYSQSQLWQQVRTNIMYV
jgi:valyl-tRNA synthetase